MVPNLTNFLGGYKTDLDDVAKSSTWPACIGPTGMAVNCKPKCRGCAHTGNHPTYGRAKFTQLLDEKYRPRLSYLRTLQYLVHRLAADAREPAGTQPGFLVHGCGNVNFTWSIGWEVLSVSENTVTLAPLSGDPREQCIGQNRYVPEETIYYCWHTSLGAGIQPNDLVTFGAPSALAGKMWCRVRRVTACDDTGVTVELDHDVSQALWSTSLTEASPTIYATSWRQSQPMEHWFAVIPSSYRKCRKASRGWQASQLVSGGAWSNNGLVELTNSANASCAVAWPEGEIPATSRPATFTCRINGIDRSSDARDRVYVVKTGNGDDGRGAWASYLALGDEDPAGNPIEAPLVTPETFVSCRVVYWAEATETDLQGNSWRIPCARRCQYSVRDFSDSAWGAPNGVATATNGEVWYCRLRKHATVTVEYDEEGRPTETVTWAQPTGIESYAPDCSLYGTCDCFAPIDRAPEGERPFTLWNSFDRFMRELASAVNIKYTMTVPGLASYMNITLCRVLHPSIASLHGSYSLENPTGWHEKTWFPDWGAGYVFDADEIEDELGNVRFALRNGIYNDATEDLSELGFGDIPEAGMLAAGLSGWTSRADPLGSAYDDTSDPLAQNRRHWYRASYRVERDSGAEGTGRRLAAYTRQIGADETLWCENVDLSVLDEEQDRGDVTFTRLSTPVTVNGTQYTGRLDVRPLITTGKTSVLVVAGEVADATDNEDGTVTVDLENTLQSWSYLRTLGGGNSWDEIVTFKAGGGFVEPYDGYKVRSYYHEDKTIGGTTNLAWIGDGVAFDLEVSGEYDATNQLYLVRRATAFGGGQDPDWGNEVVTRWMTVLGFFQADADNLLVSTGTLYGTDDDIVGIPAVCTAIVNASAEPGGKFSSTATTIKLSTTDVDTGEWSAFVAGHVVGVAGTDELMRVTGYDAEAHTIMVVRGVASTTPADIPNYTVLTLRLVTRRDTGHEYEPLTQLGGDVRPETIDMLEFWVDPQTGRIYFSAADVGLKVQVGYHVAPGLVLPDNGYVEDWIVGGANPTRAGDLDGYTADWPYNGSCFLTDLDHDDWGALDWVVWSERRETFGEVGTTPAAGQYQVAEDAAGKMVLKFHMDDAGDRVRMRVETESAAVSPGDVADVPGYGTGDEYGRNRDRIIVSDPNGVLAANVEALVGSPVRCYRGGLVLDPTQAVVVASTPCGSNVLSTVHGALVYHGVVAGEGVSLSRILLTKASVDALAAATPNICLRIT